MTQPPITTTAVSDTLREQAPADVTVLPWARDLVTVLLSGGTHFWAADNGTKQDWSRNGPLQPVRHAVRELAPGKRLMLTGGDHDGKRGTVMWLDDAPVAEDGSALPF